MKNILTVTILSIFSLSANAELLKGDWIEEGDNKLVYDTDTGLSWITLDQTFGLSINQMYSELSSNLNYDGFRYASENEVLSLTKSNMNYNIAQDTGSNGLWTNVGHDKTAWFRSVFRSDGEIGVPLHGGTMYGFFENDEAESLSQLGVNTAYWARYINTHSSYADGNYATGDIGHFIVANGAQGIFATKNPEYKASVPLSSTLALMSLSSIGLLARRRKSK